ncbi:GNAT family N-acetyltransferase [Natronosporangium hydrolyticum]|uniref:GNAT family N-acetyltransferase n=1 Tax=Natronosporangium hydrolyticum TaxID=2811111 RepID=A0A895YH87_9ACTN|nr:bifunctional GNAT family N-acetyltransferase/class I SAM-dependent methyltransferase [Natronosporangium hydrolyticum]QSB15452.1 GNAT family N-acetyltransferase [Natronosporangium hydrolyticum]
MSPTLRSDRLLLTRYTEADEERFVAFFADERVSRWMGDGPQPEAADRSLFWRIFPIYEQRRFDVWAVWWGDRYVGHAELKPTETVNGHELIYALSPEVWGQGLGTELTETLVQYGFEQLRLTEVHATVAAPNTASLALLGKLGFVPVRDIANAAGPTTRVLTRSRPARPEPQWRLEELAHAGPEHLDPEFVAGFDRKQGHPDPAVEISALRAAGVGPAATVVDFGAGTGQFAIPAAREFARVIAVDVAEPMLERLQERASGEGLTNLECVPAGFLSYEHAGSPVDAVFTRHALHQLPDFWKTIALQRIAGLLRPGGVLRLRDLIYDFLPAEAEPVFRSWFDGAATDPAQGYTAEDYATHIRTEHSTFRWLFEPMLTQAGFEILTAEYEGRCFGSYTCRLHPGWAANRS